MSYKLPPVTHGVFMSTQTQNYTGTTNGQIIHYNVEVDASSGVQLSGSTKFIVTSSGDYNIDFSAIMSQSSGTGVAYSFWLTKNGTLVDRSTRNIKIQTSSTDSLMTETMILDLNKNDYIETHWYSSSSNGQLISYAGLTLPTRPDVPSCILVIYKTSE